MKKMISVPKFFKHFVPLLFVALLVLAAVVGLSRAAEAEPSQAQPLHPTFAFLDGEGTNVLESEMPANALETCGQCHDVEFIADHSGHANLGFADFGAQDRFSDHAWDSSEGYFGNWNALEYRYLSAIEDASLDLSTSEWIMEYGDRVVGGDPTQLSRDGSTSLEDLSRFAPEAESAILNSETGRAENWDWNESGTLEMNCFLCHLDGSNNEARVDSLERGEFSWASTATLLGTGIVNYSSGEWQWQAGAFQESGELQRDFVTVQDPSNANCGQCHGVVHEDPDELLTLTECADTEWQTFTSGTVFSPQRISNSGLNLSGKDEIDRSWDIHAERLVQCVDCHYSLNNPIFYEAELEGRPEHLVFDPRRLDFGDYLYQPLHQFARTNAAQESITSERIGALQACEACHDPEPSHSWLPYPERHFEQLSCETCHISALYAPSVMQNDWTVLTQEVTGIQTCRGVEDGQLNDAADLIQPYQPALLLESRPALEDALGTYNLVSSWYWVAGDPERPVSIADLASAWLENGSYPAEILNTFDANQNGELERGELAILNAEQEAVIATRLAALGLEHPRIVGEVQPFEVNHAVTGGDFAIRDCSTCHTDDSRLADEIVLANYLPGGVLPEFLPSQDAVASGSFNVGEDGRLSYQPDFSEDGLYIIGHDSVAWVDWFGTILFIGTLLGVTVHGGLRFMAARRMKKSDHKTERVYMYGVYERLWHWLQSFTILALALTGLIIHKPAMFGFLSFRNVVLVHNILAAILIINAVLALFYHLASGEIRQYIPQPRGFFNQMVEQGLYYVRGIFKGDEHPFEKTPQKKLNPLQQVVYFGLLNVLLPLQILTGALMWGAQRWPSIAENLGGLPFLGPFHSLIAWSLTTFIVMHVYLTTTAGEKPTDGIRSMIFGWEDTEVTEKE